MPCCRLTTRVPPLNRPSITGRRRRVHRSFNIFCATTVPGANSMARSTSAVEPSGEVPEILSSRKVLGGCSRCRGWWQRVLGVRDRNHPISTDKTCALISLHYTTPVNCRFRATIGNPYCAGSTTSWILLFPKLQEVGILVYNHQQSRFLNPASSGKAHLGDQLEDLAKEGHDRQHSKQTSSHPNPNGLIKHQTDLVEHSDTDPPPHLEKSVEQYPPTFLLTSARPRFS